MCGFANAIDEDEPKRNGDFFSILLVLRGEGLGEKEWIRVSFRLLPLKLRPLSTEYSGQRSLSDSLSIRCFSYLGLLV